MSDAVDIVAACGGELITYLPYNGTAKTFLALVERRPLQPEQAGGYQYQLSTIEVTFPMDATNGVMAVQEGKDQITFKQRMQDASARTYTVSKIVREDDGLTASDGGMFTVLVEGA